MQPMPLFLACCIPLAKERVPDVPPPVLPAAPPPRLAPEPAQAISPTQIRCPKCQWQPKRASRWMCAPCGAPEDFPDGCGHVWNTFDTRGRCPGCRHQWRYTACLSCARWSLHDDWYENPRPAA